MEYERSRCPHCHHVWRYMTYKWVSTQERRDHNQRLRRECPRCGKKDGESDLDHTSDGARALDNTIKKMFTPPETAENV